MARAKHTRQVVYFVEQRGEFCFAVLGPNPDAGKEGVCYSGAHFTVCTTDGADDAALIASALNLHAGNVKLSMRRRRQEQNASAPSETAAGANARRSFSGQTP